MRPDDPQFLVRFLPALIVVYFLTRAIAANVRRAAPIVDRISTLVLVVASVAIIVAGDVGWLLLETALVTLAIAMLVEPARARGGKAGAQALLFAGLAVNIVTFAIARIEIPDRTFAFAGVSIVTCHAIAFLIDVYRAEAAARPPLTAALYLVQFPVLPAGPIVRYRDFSRFHRREDRDITLGGFTYGIRRLVIGLVKVWLVAGTLGQPVDAIFRLAPARIGPEVAWLAAIAFSLELYFQFSGYTDIAIGVGRFVGLRYPENFRRPYVADSVREFWRRWMVTALTWLRDYLSLPMAGRDAPTPRLIVNILVGFVLIGLWHGASGTVLLFAGYSAAWLAFEAIGFALVVERLPRVVRHLYLLIVVTVGWTILRAETMAQAWVFLRALAGAGGPTSVSAFRYLTIDVWTALVVAVIGAGPLVPWISRWRVSLDATTAALVMMVSATMLFIGRAWTLALTSMRGAPWRRRAEPRR